jgi:DNA repair protein RadA/Sms
MVETTRVTGNPSKINGKPVTTRRTDAKPQKLSDVKHVETERLKSGIAEFDRVVGGGIVPGSVTLLAGDPGIGKSTLLLHVISRIGGVYVSGEESAEQIKLRANRMGITGESITLISQTSLEAIMEDLATFVDVDKTKTLPLIIIDSIQTIGSDELGGLPGSVGQIRYVAEALVRFAKTKGLPLLIIGHVTKEGDIAGPKVLEHMVDTVLYFEGERYQNARILRTLKNRFGPIEEVGIFEMNDEGLKEISNPSELFLHDRIQNVPGSVVTVIMEGSRPLLVEIQALVVSSQLAIPRRVANGFDQNRLTMLTAIIQKRVGTPIGTSDIFVNVSGGLKIAEPSADLAVCLAIISSFKNVAIGQTVVAFGEVGLLGEVRRVGGMDRRTKEAKRLGFSSVISAETAPNLRASASSITG